MRKKIRKFLDAQAFAPSLILGLFVNPFYFSRRFLFKEISNFASNVSGGSLLDVGCGTKPYRHLFSVEKYDGLEYSEENLGRKNHADYVYDGHRFPFPDKSYETVICCEVFEEVFNPDEFLSEIHRTLKTGGVFLLTVPFIWDEQEQPMDFARYTSFGLDFLLSKHGFEIISHKKTGANISVFFQLWNEWIFKKISPDCIAKKIIANIFFTLSNLVGTMVSKIFPKNCDMYLNNIIVARRKI